ncbi:MAG: methyltransferase domain-containing protein, partial [Chloroflexi bacterium]|nr:methyltransferase domain-containing protein [Chloroflexota bacterium]
MTERDGSERSSLAEEGAASWEAIADGWAERVRTNTDYSRTLVLDAPHLALLGDVAGKHVLDAGCGEGRFSRMLAERGAQVTAIDLSPRMIELAREVEAADALGIEYHVSDMAGLGVFASESFDVSVAYLSIIDVADYETAIAEVSRVLRPGGQFVFSLVHPCFCPPDAAWEPRKPGTIPLRNEDKLYRKIDGYFPAREVRFKMWPTAPAATVNYHRPVGDYARACR